MSEVVVAMIGTHIFALWLGWAMRGVWFEWKAGGVNEMGPNELIRCACGRAIPCRHCEPSKWERAGGGAMSGDPSHRECPRCDHPTDLHYALGAHGCHDLGCGCTFVPDEVTETTCWCHRGADHPDYREEWRP